MNLPFSFSTLYAFKLALLFDSKREINLQSLCEYREVSNKLMIEDYNKTFNEEESPEQVDYMQEIRDFLMQYDDTFYLKGTNLCLREEVSESNIHELLMDSDEDADYLFNAMHKYGTSVKSFSMLGFNDLMNFDKKIKQVSDNLERKIEQQYMIDSTSPAIQNLLSQRAMIKLLIYTNNKKYIDEFLNIPSEDEVPIDEDFNYIKESEYTKHGDPYPIDNEVYQNSEFYEDILEEINPIQQCIEDVYQYAIFGSDYLYKDKFTEDMIKLYEQEMFSSSDTDSSDLEDTEVPFYDKLYGFDLDYHDEEQAFYITYIHNCDELIKLGCATLAPVRNRLLYLLDDATKCLYKPENLSEAYKKAKEFDEDSFDFFENESKYFIEDVFEGNAGKTIEKLLFTRTYYQLTKDEEILDLLNGYKKHPRFKQYASIVLGKGNSNKKKQTAEESESE